LRQIDENDYAYANRESARIALKILANYLGTSYSETALSIIQTASFAITKTISKLLKEFNLSPQTTQIIGGGGGASVLVPFTAKQLGIKYSKCHHAEVISSIGVASSMLQEELEVNMVNPTPEKISLAHKKIHNILVSKGALPESIMVSSEFFPDKAVLRVTATGNVELDSSTTSKSAFTLQEAKQRCSEIINLPESLIELSYETDHYFVFTGHVEEKKLFSKKNRHQMVVLDRFGRLKLSIKNGKLFQGGKLSVIEELDDFLESRNNDIAPKVYLLTDLKMIDYSSLTSNSHILNAVKQEADENEKISVIVEL
ncbi:MAG: hydantoinase/oxoprolinase family protein, partial [Nitrosopumilaceae archaeon]|nr:hydantoinase/oxoprolinase family protein [Nitrosopumilaceae archaeon]